MKKGYQSFGLTLSPLDTVMAAPRGWKLFLQGFVDGESWIWGGGDAFPNALPKLALSSGRIEIPQTKVKSQQ